MEGCPATQLQGFSLPLSVILGMHKTLFPLAVLGFLFSCTGKKEKENSFFPVLSFINSQVAHVDTSVYSIIKVVSRGGARDTQYIRREDFRKVASDFLTLPDISKGDESEGYNESQVFVQDLNLVSLNYTPKEIDEDTEIRRQEVMIAPGASETDNVKTIFIDRWKENDDSTVQKLMTWEVGKGFEIKTRVSKKGRPDQLERTIVNWSLSRSAD
jgi:hypothetical protein